MSSDEIHQMTCYLKNLFSFDKGFAQMTPSMEYKISASGLQYWNGYQHSIEYCYTYLIVIQIILKDYWVSFNTQQFYT